MMTQAQADDFDIGKAIFDQLKDLPPERQQRVLRWVAEGLGVQVGPQVVSVTQTTGGMQAPQVQPGAAAGSVTDIKSFIAAKAPKSDSQFAAAVAYFYHFEAPPAERRDTIDAVALQEAARLAGRKRLSNPLGTLNNSKKLGYLDATVRGQFGINSVGENLVAMTLPGGGETPRQARKKSAKKSAKKAASKSKKG
jgi:hypothetical protein